MRGDEVREVHVDVQDEIEDRAEEFHGRRL
jgi:hypothetical protein